jgi:hypothetical protein
MTEDRTEPLRPKLERAQRTLEDALQRACSSDVREADTGELIRIEEVLAIANEAAKEAISVRRRLGRDKPSVENAPTQQIERVTRERPAPLPDTHREFEDEKGVRWTAFSVTPSALTTGRAALRGPYQQGWLAFDCGAETRRLAPTPDRWNELSDDELRRLCAQAELAPRRSRPPRPPQPPTVGGAR